MEIIFTGVEDPDRIILLNLPDKKLFAACQVNKYAQKLCNNGFWIRRFEQKFGATIGEGNKINYREEYIAYMKRIDYDDQIDLAIKNTHNDLAIALINKHLIPYFENILNNSEKLAVLTEYIRMSIKYDNFPIFIVLYKIAEEFKLSHLQYQLDSFLLNAVRAGSYSIVKFIIDTLKYDSEHKEKIMKEVAEANSLIIIRFLRANGYPLPPVLLWTAIAKKNTDMIKYLIDEKIEFDTENIPIHQSYILRLGIKMLTYMKDHGYNVAKIGEVLAHAVTNDFNEKYIKWLIENGANVNFDDGRALLLTIRSKNYKLAQLLIDSGARFDFDNFLRNLINNITVNDVTDYIQFLIKNGLNLLESGNKIVVSYKTELYPIIFEIASTQGPKTKEGDAKRQKFYEDFLESISNLDSRYVSRVNVEDIIPYLDVENGNYFKIALDNDWMALASALLDTGTPKFHPGDVAKIAITNQTGLLEKMFKRGAEITKEDMDILNSYNEQIKIRTLLVLTINGFEFTKNSSLITYYADAGAGSLSKHDILFLYEHGLTEFTDEHNNKILNEIKKQHPKPKTSTLKTETDSKDTPIELVRCVGKTKTGTQCKRKCSKDDKYCFAHK